MNASPASFFYNLHWLQPFYLHSIQWYSNPPCCILTNFQFHKLILCAAGTMKMLHSPAFIARLVLVGFLLLCQSLVEATASKEDERTGNLRHATDGSIDALSLPSANSIDHLLEAYRSLADVDKYNFLARMGEEMTNTGVLVHPKQESNRNLEASTTTLVPGTFGKCQTNNIGQIFLCGTTTTPQPPPTDECNPNPCQNGGSCFTKSNGSFKGCACLSGFGGERCEINFSGGGGGGEECHGQWIKYKDHVCRMPDGSNGKEDVDFRIRTECDKDCCASRCCDNPRCMAYEYRDDSDRCELWWTVPSIPNMEYKETNRCYIKPSAIGGGGGVVPDNKAPWAHCVSSDANCWAPYIEQIGYFHIQSAGSNKCWAKMDDEKVRLETCDDGDQDQLFHFHRASWAGWKISWNDESSTAHVRGTNVDPDSTGTQGKLIISNSVPTVGKHSYFFLDYHHQEGTFRIRIHDTDIEFGYGEQLYATNQSGSTTNDTPLVLRTESRMRSAAGSNDGYYNLIPVYNH